MINKNQFRVDSDKKVLHKIGKRWVTVSVAMLALLGGSLVMGHKTTHADATTPSAKAQNTNTTKKVLNQSLQKNYNLNVQQKPTVASAKPVQPSSASAQSAKPSAIQSSAANMHNALLQNAVNQKPSAKSAGSSVASNVPIHQSAQPNSAYEAYLKANPQLANLYNETANQSNSNVVSNLANNKKNKPLMKLGDAQAEQYSIMPKFDFRTGGNHTLINKNIQPSAFIATATPGSTESFDITKFFGGSKIGNTYVLANPNQTVSVKFGNNGQYSWIGDNTFHWLSQKSAPVKIQYPDNSYHTFTGYVDDPITTADGHIQYINKNNQIEKAPFPTGYDGLYTNAKYTNASQQLPLNTISWGQSSASTSAPVTVQIIDATNPNKVLKSVKTHALLETPTSTWALESNTQSLYYSYLSNNSNFSYLPNGSIKLNYDTNGLSLVDINGDGRFQKNANGQIQWITNASTGPIFKYVQNSPALYTNLTFNIKTDSGFYQAYHYPTEVNGRYAASNGEQIKLPINLSTTMYNPVNNFIGKSGQFPYQEAAYTMENTKEPTATYNNGKWTWTNGNTYYLKSNLITMYVDFINQNGQITQKTYSDIPEAGVQFDVSDLDYGPLQYTNMKNKHYIISIPQGYSYDDLAEKQKAGLADNRFANIGTAQDAWNGGYPTGTKNNPLKIYMTGNNIYYSVHQNGAIHSYQYQEGTKVVNDAVSGQPIPNQSNVPSPWNTNINQLVLHYYDDSKPQNPSKATNDEEINGYPIAKSYIDVEQNGTVMDLDSDSYVPTGYRLDMANLNVPDVYIFGQKSSFQHGNTTTLNIPVEPNTKPTNDAINSASSLVNSDLTKAQYLSSADANDKFATSQVNSINSDVKSIKADIQSINNDRVTENSANVTAEIASANNAYDNAYSANAAIGSLMNTSLSTDNSEIGSLSTQINNSVSSIVNNDIKPDETKYNQATTNASNALTSLTSEDGKITANSTSATSFSNELSRLNGDISNDESRIGNDETNINKHQNNIDSLSTDYNALSGDYTNLNNSIQAVSGVAQKASTVAQNALTSANTNAGAINGIKNELSNYNTISSDAVNAMGSLNADKNELSWLANSESALSTGSSQASSNAGWIKANSASVSALSGKWTSVNARISNDSKALNNAINTKANNASLTADYTKLSGDISTASGLANTANQLAVGNQTWIHSNLASLSNASNEAKSASDKANTNSTAISNLQKRLASYNTVSFEASNAVRSLNADSAELNWLANSEATLSLGSSQASSNARWIKANAKSVATLSSGWSSIEANINKDSTALSQAIAGKADQSSLTADSSALNSNITVASNLASSANSLAKTNQNWITNNSGSLSNASAKASEASASASTNADNINGLKARVAKDETSIAVNSVVAQNALSNAGDALQSLDDVTTRVDDNASALGNLKNSYSALNNQINGKNGLTSEINADEASINGNSNSLSVLDNSLANNEAILSADAQNASSLASSANSLATKNSSEINTLKSNTAITFTFTQNGNNALIPVTLTNGYVKANAKHVSGNTYDVTSLLNEDVALNAKHVVGTYTVTLGIDDNGNATLHYNAPKDVRPQKMFSESVPVDNGMTTYKLGTPNQQRKAWNYVQNGLGRKGLTLGDANKVPASTDTAHYVVLANNQAEYTGTITLNFGNRQTKLTFDTGADNSDALTSDAIDILNYADHAKNPSDYAKDNLIKGFDTTGFKFVGAAKGSEPTSFTIMPSDATNQNGPDVHSNYDITLNYSAQAVTDNIQYMYGSHNENAKAVTVNGNDDTQGNWTSTDNLKPGWQLANADNPFTFTNNGTVQVSVKPVQTTDTINYVDQDGKNVCTQSFTGNDYQATDAGDNNIDVTSGNTDLDKNYTINNGQDTTFKYDGGTYTVNVTGSARTPNSKIPSSTKPNDANNPKSNKSMTKPTGDSDVLFTINVRDYNADGSKEINHYTKYAIESGKVGDPFAIKASDYLTNGFITDTKKSADSTVDGTIGDNQLQPNNITFNYYAKPYDPNAYKRNPNDPTLPKPITVQYVGELNGKADQVVKAYSDVITGNTGDTGTLSNIENTAPVPKGYTVNGNNYNYTITTDPQTIKVDLNSKTAKQMNSNYKPKTPSTKATTNVPSDNTVKTDAKHSFATVIINEIINGKVAHTYAQSVDESNVNVGSAYTIMPTSFTPNGYGVDAKDKALTGVIEPDGSLSNGSATFDYDVNSSEIAPITVTYSNQYGNWVNKITGASSRTGARVNESDATVTITSAQLATKGAVGDYINIIGFLKAPLGHHFNKNVVDSSNNPLSHVQLQKVNSGRPVHLGLTLFMATPKRKPGANSKAKIKPDTKPSVVIPSDKTTINKAKVIPGNNTSKPTSNGTSGNHKSSVIIPSDNTSKPSSHAKRNHSGIVNGKTKNKPSKSENQPNMNEHNRRANRNKNVIPSDANVTPLVADRNASRASYTNVEPVHVNVPKPTVATTQHNNNGKLPQTNEAGNASAIAAVMMLLTGISFAGVDLDREHSI